MLEINTLIGLPVDRWKEYRDIRLEMTKNDSWAFTPNHEDLLKLSEEEWKSELEDKRNTYFFLEDSGVLVGMSSIRTHIYNQFKHNVSFDMLYVNPEYRGRDLGKRLTEERIDYVKEQGGVKNVICEIFSSQIPSLEFHKQLGFEEVGRIKDFAQYEGKYFDSVFMQLELA